MSATSFQLGLDLLDHQIVDSDGMDCGNVDDLELEGGAEGEWRVSALLVGPGAWPERLGGVSGRVARAVVRRVLSGDGMVRVPFGEVAEMGATIVLAHRRAHYGLDRPDQRVARFLRFLPGHEG